VGVRGYLRLESTVTIKQYLAHNVTMTAEITQSPCGFQGMHRQQAHECCVLEHPCGRCAWIMRKRAHTPLAKIQKIFLINANDAY
jgi:hypothetical protein